MHAIQRYQYDRLLGYLNRLQQESKIFNLSGDHINKIALQEEKLTQLYNNYQAALQQVSALINQYEQEHRSVRRLIISHKQHRKRSRKKEVLKQYN